MLDSRSVDICVATFRRPDSLALLLRSLTKLHRRDLVNRVIVVDNDHGGTARSAVETFGREGPFEVVYDVEPEQNIARARNRALSLVLSPYFAIVDDDEIVSPEWLVNMCRALPACRADAVFGPVVKVLPPTAPAWAASHPVFSTPNRPTGAPVLHGNTGNVLVRTAALGQPRQMFDPAYGLTGGEDADFFERLRRSGRRLRWCADAPVLEEVSDHRLTVSWVHRRSYRSGQTFYRVFVKPLPAARKVFWLSRKLVHLVGAASMTAIAYGVRHRRRTEASAALLRCAGQLNALLAGRALEEYGPGRSG